jgi:hypothetical protein
VVAEKQIAVWTKQSFNFLTHTKLTPEDYWREGVVCSLVSSVFFLNFLNGVNSV